LKGDEDGLAIGGIGFLDAGFGEGDVAFDTVAIEN
jgi:hypothetical protein